MAWESGELCVEQDPSSDYIVGKQILEFDKIEKQRILRDCNLYIKYHVKEQSLAMEPDDIYEFGMGKLAEDRFK